MHTPTFFSPGAAVLSPVWNTVSANCPRRGTSRQRKDWDHGEGVSFRQHMVWPPVPRLSP